MAQEWLNGFLVDSTTKKLIVTTVTTGAVIWGDGFLRDTTGRLVIR
jgi:hypothetical protein